MCYEIFGTLNTKCICQDTRFNIKESKAAYSVCLRLYPNERTAFQTFSALPYCSLNQWSAIN